MKKTREDWKRESHNLRLALRTVRDLLQENRIEEATMAADVAIGPNSIHVASAPSTEPSDTRYIENYTIAPWSPHPTPGIVPPTQVHFIINLRGEPPMALRLKSPRAIDELISVLAQYRGVVWGGRPS